jgi:hypothetical protein
MSAALAKMRDAFGLCIGHPIRELPFSPTSRSGQKSRPAARGPHPPHHVGRAPQVGARPGRHPVERTTVVVVSACQHAGVDPMNCLNLVKIIARSMLLSLFVASGAHAAPAESAADAVATCGAAAA